jgi:predicted kinase
MAIYTVRHISELPKVVTGILGNRGIIAQNSENKGNGAVTWDADDDNTRSVLVTLVGCPASGKSTVRAAIMRMDSIALCRTCICPDDIRQGLFGDMSDQSHNGKVWDVAMRRLDESLSIHGNLVVFDSTASHVRDRRRLAGVAASHGSIIIEVWCDTPLEECIERNGSRDRHVPQDVIVRMNASIHENPPVGDDFADDIIIVRTGS